VGGVAAGSSAEGTDLQLSLPDTAKESLEEQPRFIVGGDPSGDPGGKVRWP
jgi:hypothetical protein